MLLIDRLSDLLTEHSRDDLANICQAADRSNPQDIHRATRKVMSAIQQEPLDDNGRWISPNGELWQAAEITGTATLTASTESGAIEITWPESPHKGGAYGHPKLDCHPQYTSLRQLRIQNGEG